MPIDIDRLTEAELIDLNHRIVERLRFLQQMRAHAQMLEFAIGDRVTFQPDAGPAVVGVITRYNRKTVTLIGEDGRRWNVAPGFLRRVGADAGAGGKVVKLRRE
jgi:acetyl-CoA carboxylase alpha subunit